MLESGWRLAFKLAGGFQARVSMVLFHRVLAAPDTLLKHEPDIAYFESQIRWLRDSFNILTVREAARRLYDGSLEPGTLCVTFDDGYRDNALNALPILQRLKVPATFFVTTAYTGGGLMWNDRVVEAVRRWAHTTMDLEDLNLGRHALTDDRSPVLDALLGQMKYLPYEQRDALASALIGRATAPPERMMMDEDEIRRLHAAGMEIGGHTVSHPILSALDDAAAAREIVDNKTRLEQIIGEPIVTFAYPNGRPQRDYQTRHLSILRDCGYRYAVTTSPGTASRRSDPLQMPRFTPWDRSRSKYLARMLRNCFVPATEVGGPV